MNEMKTSVSVNISSDGRSDITISLRRMDDEFDPIHIIQGDPDDVGTILRFTLAEWEKITAALDSMLRKEWPV